MTNSGAAFGRRKGTVQVTERHIIDRRGSAGILRVYDVTDIGRESRLFRLFRMGGSQDVACEKLTAEDMAGDRVLSEERLYECPVTVDTPDFNRWSRKPREGPPTKPLLPRTQTKLKSKSRAAECFGEGRNVSGIKDAEEKEDSPVNILRETSMDISSPTNGEKDEQREDMEATAFDGESDDLDDSDDDVNAGLSVIAIQLSSRDHSDVSSHTPDAPVVNNASRACGEEQHPPRWYPCSSFAQTMDSIDRDAILRLRQKCDTLQLCATPEQAMTSNSTILGSFAPGRPHKTFPLLHRVFDVPMQVTRKLQRKQQVSIPSRRGKGALSLRNTSTSEGGLAVRGSSLVQSSHSGPPQLPPLPTTQRYVRTQPIFTILNVRPRKPSIPQPSRRPKRSRNSQIRTTLPPICSAIVPPETSRTATSSLCFADDLEVVKLSSKDTETRQNRY